MSTTMTIMKNKMDPELPSFELSSYFAKIPIISPEMAMQNARDLYTRRMEGVSIWVVPSSQIIASDPDDKSVLFDPSEDKIYRHPTFYNLPDELEHM